MRVLHLYWGVKQNGINPEVIEHAADCRDARPLLPALRRLTIEPAQPITCVATTFLPPTVTALNILPFCPRTIDIEGWYIHCLGVEPVLQHVTSTCLYMEDIKVHGCGGPEQFLLMSRCNHLRSLLVSWGPMNRRGLDFDQTLL